MYKDTSSLACRPGNLLSAEQQNGVEQKLSILEGHAGATFKKILAACETGATGVQLTDAEHITVVKFACIMKFRSTLFFDAFNHEYPSDYAANDKLKALAYMAKKGHRRPIDVWLETVVGILDLKMDGEEKEEWWLKLQDIIFPPCAIWAQICMRFMYPVICRPADPDQEFVLTEHAYSSFEGPVFGDTYTEFHVICVSAPRITLLLRCECLPQVVKEPDEALNVELEKELAAVLIKYPDPDAAKSILHDLPVAKPLNTHIVDDFGIPNLQLMGQPAPKIAFPIFALEKDYINTINLVILEEAYDLPLIAYKSGNGLKLALEAYLRRPVSSGTFAMKRSPTDQDPKILYIKKLAVVAKQLGSTVTAVYHVRWTID